MDSGIPFIGTGWGFPPTFDKISRTVEMTSGNDDIRGSLEILLSTSLGERVMQPDFGCNLRSMLFEPLDVAMQAYLQDLITTAILYHEPRIQLEKVSLQVDPSEGHLGISLDYLIRNTNSRYNSVFPYYVNEGRGAR